MNRLSQDCRKPDQVKQHKSIVFRHNNTSASDMRLYNLHKCSRQDQIRTACYRMVSLLPICSCSPVLSCMGGDIMGYASITGAPPNTGPGSGHVLA